MKKIIFITLISLLVFSCSNNTNLSTPKNQNNTTQSNADKKTEYKVYLDDSYVFKGNANAKNTVIEYIDFKCHFCADSKPIIDKLLEKYPEQVKVVFKHYPFINEVSLELAYLFEKVALNDKNRAIELYNYIFTNQSKIQTIDEVKNLEKQFLNKEISNEQFEKIKEKIKRDKAEADSFGINGTPLFVINGNNLIKGFLPEKEFFDNIMMK
ncbi:MAG: thioredoxin domain-containing protein [Candidatus Sericytochromatia bacterium]